MHNCGWLLRVHFLGSSDTSKCSHNLFQRQLGMSKMLYSIGPSPARPSGGGSLFVVLPELPLLSVAEMRPGMLRPAR